MSGIDKIIDTALRPLLAFYGISLDSIKGSRGIYDVEMKFTPGIKWKMVRTKNQLVFTPDFKIKGIKNIHYTFPLPVGVWIHKTVTWENGHKEHTRIKMSTRLFDMAKDFLKYKNEYGQEK